MSEFAEGVFELALTGVVLIILGVALAPLLPYNIALIGWILLALAVMVAVVGVVIGLSQLLNSIS